MTNLLKMDMKKKEVQGVCDTNSILGAMDGAQFETVESLTRRKRSTDEKYLSQLKQISKCLVKYLTTLNEFVAQIMFEERVRNISRCGSCGCRIEYWHNVGVYYHQYGKEQSRWFSSRKRAKAYCARSFLRDLGSSLSR